MHSLSEDSLCCVQGSLAHRVQRSQPEGPRDGGRMRARRGRGGRKAIGREAGRRHLFTAPGPGDSPRCMRPHRLTGGRQGEGVLQSWCGASTAPSFPQLPAICHRCQHHVLSQQGLPGLPEGKGGTGYGEGAKPGSRMSTGNGAGADGKAETGVDGWQSVRGHRLRPAVGPAGLRGSPEGRLSWP